MEIFAILYAVLVVALLVALPPPSELPQRSKLLAAVACLLVMLIGICGIALLGGAV